MGHIIDRGHSISAGASALSKLNARCRLYDPSRTVVHYVIKVCTCRKRLPSFQTNMGVTKSIAMCRIEMKRCRFGMQNGVLHLFSLRTGTFSPERGMGQFISSAAFKLPQSFRTSTDFIRIGSRLFIFDRRQWISAGAFNFSMDIQKPKSCDQCQRGALCRFSTPLAL